MAWSARRHREDFSGWIAGLGTDRGHRLVVGHWPSSSYGPVTDVMAEDPAGHRTLYAPTPQLAALLLGAAYRLHDVQLAPCSARRSGACWMSPHGGCCQESAPVAGPATDAASGPAPMNCNSLIAADATLAGRGLGALRAVHPPVGFGFGSVRPDRPWVHLTTTIEAVYPPHGGGRA